MPRISFEQCLPLRARILRPNHPATAAQFPQDPSAVHFGVFDGDVLVSTVTAHPEDRAEYGEAGQWRIRGMATDTVVQSKGFGGLVLKELLDWGRAERIPLFWCNARERAIPFYLRHGFTVESEMFDIAGIGPHKVMKIVL